MSQFRTSPLAIVNLDFTSIELPNFSKALARLMLELKLDFTEVIRELSLEFLRDISPYSKIKRRGCLTPSLALARVYTFRTMR